MLSIVSISIAINDHSYIASIKKSVPAKITHNLINHSQSKLGYLQTGKTTQFFRNADSTQEVQIVKV